jgi:uncharacterized protein DUF3300/endosialidase-like protein
MIRTLIFALFLLTPVGAIAQTQQTPQANPPLLKPEELDQLVAPIALYPDPLLAEVLMASSYPLDIVQAERWLQSHKNLKGDQLRVQVEKQDWDDSIKSLVATPEVLAMMSEKLDWTEKLGDAVVAQQPDVMDAVQRLRAKAQANDKLKSSKQQTVTVNQAQGKQIIAIAPTDPDTVYVPYYDPAVVYGSWPYPDYPPYYWPPPPYIGYGLLATGLAFGAGWALGNWWSGGYWGGNINWSGGGNNINITPPGNRPAHPIGGGNGNRWQPRVDHRQAAGNRGQRDFRGTGGQQVLKPGAKPGAKPGTKPGGGRTNVGQGNRPNKGASVSHHGKGQRASAKTRPSNRAANKRPSHRTAGARPSHRAGGRQHANLAGRGGRGGLRAHGGGGRAAARGGGGRGGGGGGRRGGGGGRRSDIRLKHDVVLIGYLNDGLGLYRFSYNGSNTPYVGVIAQEVAQVEPQAVTRGRDGYLRVYYDRLGLKFQRYDQWYASHTKPFLPAR